MKESPHSAYPIETSLLSPRIILNFANQPFTHFSGYMPIHQVPGESVESLHKYNTHFLFVSLGGSVCEEIRSTLVSNYPQHDEDDDEKLVVVVRSSTFYVILLLQILLLLLLLRDRTDGESKIEEGPQDFKRCYIRI